jgi:hypothetical protein
MADRTVRVVFQAAVDSWRRDLGHASTSVRTLEDDTKRAARSTTQATASMSRDWDRTASGMRSVGTAMSVTLTPALIALGVKGVNAASDLNEAVAATGVVFGQSGRAMEAWADTAAESFGQSKRQALEAAVGFGNFFDALGLTETAAVDMSQTVVELASDMASFSNEDPADMLERLRSGLAGEVEPLRRFGVDLSAAAVNAEAMRLGLANASGELDQAALVQARFSLLLAQTANQQGDFARTSDSLANSQRSASAAFEEAAAALGERLIPAVTSLTQFATGVFEAFEDLPPALQNVVIGFGGVAAAAGPLLIVGSKLITSWSTISNSVGGLSRVLSSPNVWGGAAAIAGLVLLQDQLTETFRAAENFAAAFAAGLTTDDPAAQVAALEEEVDALLDTAERGGSINFGLFRFFTDSNAQQAYNNARALEEQIDAVRETMGLSAEDYGHATSALGEFGREVGATAPKVDELTAAEEHLALRLGGTSAAMADVSASTSDARAEADSYTVTLSGFTRETEAATATVDAYSTALDRLLGVNITAEEAVIDYTRSLNTLTSTVTENGATLDLNSEAGLENREAILGVVNAALAHIDAAADQGATLDELGGVMDQHRQDLVAVLEQTGLTREEAEAYIETLGLTPESITTTFRTEGMLQAEQEAARFRNALAAIGTTIEATQARIGLAIQGQANFGGAPFAAGGRVGGGWGTHDTVPAMLTEGEYVIPTRSVRHYGEGVFEALRNQWIDPSSFQGFAAGGSVTATGSVTGLSITEMPPALALHPGIGWQAMMAALRTVFPGLALISGFRPGAITATGNPSYHGFGRAVDIPPRTDVNHWIYNNYKTITKELIASWAGARQIRNGRDHVYSGITRANHWDHNHWAMANGGMVTRPTRALIGEAGPEAIVPLNRSAPLPVDIVSTSGLGAAGISNRPQWSPLAGAFGGQGSRPGPLPTLPEIHNIADGLQDIADALEAAADAADEASDAFDDGLDSLRRMLAEEKRIRAQMAEVTRRYYENVDLLEEQHADRVRDALDSRGQSLRDFASVSDRFVAGWGNSAGALTRNIVAQAETITRWAAAMDDLRARGLDEGLIAALGLDDPANFAQAEQLVRATSGELDQLNAAWAQRQGVIGDRVAQEQEDLIGGLGDTLVEMQGELTDALSDLQEDFVADMAVLRDDLMAIGEDAGLTFAEAIAAGLASGIPGIEAQVAVVLGLLATAQAAAREAAALAAGGRGGPFVPRPGIPGGHGGQTPGGFNPADVAAGWGGVTRPNTNATMLRSVAPDTGTQRMELVLDDGSRFGAYVRTQAAAEHNWRARRTTAQAVR